MFVISIPVWGQPYLETFARATFPALKAAVEDFDHAFKFVIHTDNPAEIERLTAGYQVEIRRIVGDATYVTLQISHADAIAQAGHHDRVILLNADIVVSKNLLHRAYYHFERGMTAVVTMGVRTIKDSRLPPIGAAPNELLSWAWANRHQIIEDLIWGNPNGSVLPTNIFFVNGDTVVARGFHLHPVAILKHKPLEFISTIDGDLLDQYARGTIHLVTTPDDLAICEISDTAKRFPVMNEPMNVEQVASAMSNRASELHRWQFTQRIIIKGNGEGTGDEEVAAKILERMGTNTHFHRPL